MLYNIFTMSCHVMLYTTCYVYYITCVVLCYNNVSCYITRVMLPVCHITYVMSCYVCYITCVMLCLLYNMRHVMLYNICYVIIHVSCYVI